MDKPNILISGGSGLIGSHLAPLLEKRGYNVAILSRSPGKPDEPKTYIWDINKGFIENDALEGVDIIIHLAGAPIIGKRWTKKRKQSIIDSRVQSGKLLFEKVKERDIPLKAFISSSAVGYYGGVTVDHVFKESDPPANDFLGHTCQLWEQAANQFKEIGVRSATIRTGIVLSKDDGALPVMALPVKFGLGAPLGSGKQIIPWIHIDDVCHIYLKAVEDIKMSGPYNAAAPSQVSNGEFTKTLARVLQKPVFLPKVPGWLLNLVMGEMGKAVLEGSSVDIEKLKNAGYRFEFEELEDALRDIYSK